MIAELLTLLALAVTAVVLIYTLSMFRDWVRTNIGNYRNREILSGLVRERLSNGDFKVVPFLYDQKKKNVIKNNVYQAELFDEELEEQVDSDGFMIDPISQKN